MSIEQKIYSEDKILNLWKNITNNIENFDFEYNSEKEQTIDLLSSLECYFYPSILALKETNEVLYDLLTEINEILDKTKYGAFHYNDSNRILSLANSIEEYFTSIEGIKFYVKQNNEYQKLLKSSKAQISHTTQEAKKEFSEMLQKNEEDAKKKINDVLGNYSINSIDYIFLQKHNEIKQWLFCKQIILYLLCVFIPFLLIDVMNSLPEVWDKSWEFIFLRVIILLPIVWLFPFLSSQIKEDRKTAQSYLHKGIVARSYVNYSRTLNENNIFEDDQELKKELITLLLKGSIDILKEDPVVFWDKITKDNNNINIQSIIEKLIDKAPNKKSY